MYLRYVYVSRYQVWRRKGVCFCRGYTEEGNGSFPVTLFESKLVEHDITAAELKLAVISPLLKSGIGTLGAV